MWLSVYGSEDLGWEVDDAAVAVGFVRSRVRGG